MNQDPPKGAPISPAEKPIFALVAAGLLDKQIAHIRGLSEQTVKAHCQSIRRKLGVSNRTEVALIWHGVAPDQIEAARREGEARL